MKRVRIEIVGTGEVLEGNSYREVVIRLSEGGLETPPSVEQYIKEALDRIELQFGIYIKGNPNPKQFVKKLIETGILRKAGS